MDLPYFPSPYMLLCLFNSAGHALNKSLRETHSPLIVIYYRFSFFFLLMYMTMCLGMCYYYVCGKGGHKQLIVLEMKEETLGNAQHGC